MNLFCRLKEMTKGSKFSFYSLSSFLPFLIFVFFFFYCQIDGQQYGKQSKLFNKTIGSILTDVPLVEINRRQLHASAKNTFSSRPLFVGFISNEDKDKIDLVKTWKKHRGPAWQFDELADFFPLRIRGEKGEFQLEIENLLEGMEGVFARIQKIEEFDFINNIYFFDGEGGKQLDRESDLAELVLASNRNTFDYKRCPKIAAVPPIHDAEVNF